MAADDEASAQAALAAVEVQIDAAAGVLHRRRRARRRRACCCTTTSPATSSAEVEQDFGDVDAGFAAADLVLERHFDCAEVAHGQIELNSTVAQWEPERERLTVHSVTQVPYYLHLTLAQTLGLDASQIRVVKPFVGGGFGHRVEPLNFEMVCAALARAAGGAVSLHLTREEGFLTHRGRPASETRLKIGLKNNGEITAVEAEVVQRGGAYGGYGLVTILYAGALLHALYRVGAVRYRGYRVYTNLPPCGAMRGHGAVNVRFAFESLLDEMAAQLELDPFALRRANLLAPPDPHAQRPAGQLLRPAAMPRCGGGRVGLACAARPAAARAGAWAWPARTTCRARPSRCTGAASRMRW